MKLFGFATCVAILCAVPATVRAGILNQIALPESSNAANFVIDDVQVSVSSHGGNMKRKTVAGFTAMGVAGGTVDGEIDKNEYLLFTFSAPVHITSLSIAHLYKAGNYGDFWNEEAMFVTSAGTFELQVATATTANWDGLGSVINDSPALEHNGGAWTIAGVDIFGSPITSLKLKSGNPGDHPKYGDYGFRELSFIAVPGPGALAVLGLAGLVGGRRRR